MNIQKFRVVNNAADAAQVPGILSKLFRDLIIEILIQKTLNSLCFFLFFVEAKEYVIKAQVHAGGRGLGHFNNGFKSGVHITKELVIYNRIICVF